jgi:hypothetical protein
MLVQRYVAGDAKTLHPERWHPVFGTILQVGTGCLAGNLKVIRRGVIRPY